MNCAGCLHPNRDALDAQLVAGVPYRAISATFNLSLGAISRHKRHVKEMIQARTTTEMSEHSSTLYNRVERLVDEAEQILAKAKAKDDFRGANGALGAAAKLLDLLGRASGELQSANVGGIHLTQIKVTNINTSNDDRELAELIREATADFNPAVIERFKQLAACTVDAPPLLTR
jgi:hypothetical protein